MPTHHKLCCSTQDAHDITTTQHTCTKRYACCAAGAPCLRACRGSTSRWTLTKCLGGGSSPLAVQRLPISASTSPSVPVSWEGARCVCVCGEGLGHYRYAGEPVGPLWTHDATWGLTQRRRFHAPLLPFRYTPAH